jgi:hypothetical protein
MSTSSEMHVELAECCRLSLSQIRDKLDTEKWLEHITAISPFVTVIS